MDKEKETLSIIGMHCVLCENAIMTGLDTIKGVVKAKADYIHGTLSIIYDPNKISIDDLSIAVIGLGFACTNVWKGEGVIK